MTTSWNQKGPSNNNKPRQQTNSQLFSLQTTRHEDSRSDPPFRCIGSGSGWPLGPVRRPGTHRCNDLRLGTLLQRHQPLGIRSVCPGTAPGGPPPPPPTTPVPAPPPVTTVSPPTTTPPTAPPPVTPGTCPALPSASVPQTRTCPTRSFSRTVPLSQPRPIGHAASARSAPRFRPTSWEPFPGSRNQGRSISFAVTINKPSGTNVPPIIAYGAASIPIPAGVATITYNNDEVAQQQGGSSRGRGKFYDLYGSSHSAGALTAWAWGVARIIDALEATPAYPAANGSPCWRIADWQKQNGQNVQTASQIVGENVWLGTAFNTYTSNVRALPFDHHMLAGLVAPRALYVMENSDMEWLGWTATYGCMGAARKQWEALGALDNFGYSQVGGNSHCSFPAAKQGSELTAFINKFLLQSGGGTTSIFRTEKNHGSFNLNTWASWSVPTLT
ncbi:Cip2 [Verticillium alfalfae VaMs.102]|uniref:(4-O-methyl)-D-glucuronate--lignin esterase n=1 Tax=Verticillium alfalfae (strain VaMs.102 / ATCC MYA-4576 / FGSC 10136) TaxID=526221 RepID=C9S5V2_VERA1|nr:Cip2 [Verticillium alfalfae VaMs.102]EEY15091.1 Cip2 [Verticillium alfalfae VaMs.102]